MIVIDNLMAFYIVLAIVFLGFVLLAIFGTTEDREAVSKRKR